MGSMAAAQLEAALDVLERRDDKAAERIIGNDEEIDKLEREISQDAMTLALRGPLPRNPPRTPPTLTIVRHSAPTGHSAANAPHSTSARTRLTHTPHPTALHARAPPTALAPPPPRR